MKWNGLKPVKMQRGKEFMKVTMNLDVDTRDTSVANIGGSTIQIVPQTNGVIRFHGTNGCYLFSIVRTLNGDIHAFQNGFGLDKPPHVIYQNGELKCLSNNKPATKL